MEWGSSEEYAKTSPKIVKRLHPLVHVEVRRGYNHCEYMIKKNTEYVAAIESCGDGAESGGQVH
jgi:hypothetical protein